MIELDGVSKRFGPVLAVDGASLKVARGEFIALLGPSGCGKTTLLRLVAGFEVPELGRVCIGGGRVAGEGAWVPPERRRVGMVFQDYALFPHLTVAENVGFGLPKGGRAARVAEVLGVVGLGALASRHPHELSGGQQQRVALARAVAPEPAIILLDEPWSNIDPLLRASMRGELASILRALEVTVVLVTHEREEAFAVADRVALMRDGAVIQVGSPEMLYGTPASRWAAEFIGAANFLPGIAENGHVSTSLGRFRVENPGRQGAVEALLRPELLILEPTAEGSARVVEREFRGHDVVYRVELADGTIVSSQRPSNESVPPDSHVRVLPVAGSVSVF